MATKPTDDLRRASDALVRQLSLTQNQPGLPDMHAATDYMHALNHTLGQAQLAVTLLAEFVRSEHEADALVMAPETDGDPTHTKSMVLLGCRSALAALDAAARSLGATQEQMQLLDTRNSSEADRPPQTTAEQRAKGRAMNLLALAVLGDDPTVDLLTQRMQEYEASELLATLKAVSAKIAAAQGWDVTP